jgi:hypothetical protein
LALVSIVRLMRTDRKLAFANGLIIAGVLAPVYGGTLFAFGEAATFAASLLLGALLIWAGYRTGQVSRT